MASGASDDDIETRRLRASLESRLFGDSVEPTRAGRFELRESLGAGAMGTVYRAFDPDLQREVAVKVLRADLPAGSSDWVARLQREARALAQLNHPNVVEVLDVGVEAGEVFIAMAYVRGVTLGAWASTQAPGPARFAALGRYATQAAAGLVAAHRAGIVHRDVKPQNMLIGDDGRLRIVDFGLASDDASQDAASVLSEDRRGSGSGSLSLTRTGHAVGTPLYMAPEQFDGRATPASDQYGFAVAFWEAAYGSRPFDGPTVHALLASIERGPPQHRSDAIPRWFHRILVRALAYDPARRYASMDDVLEALSGPNPWASVALSSAAAIAVAAGVVVGGVLGGDAQPTACDSATSRIEGVWTSSRQARLSALPGGDDVVAGLDRYAEAWSAERRAACEAESDAAMRCLDDAVESLDAMLSAAADLPRDSVDAKRLQSALPGLDSLETCGAAKGPNVPPPDDPRVAATVRALEDERRRLAATIELGAPQSTAQWSVDLLERARVTDYDPLVARVLVDRGQRLSIDGDPAAADAFDEAAVLAKRSGAFDTAFDATLRLAWMQAAEGRTDDAERSVAAARAMLDRVEGPTAQRQAQASLFLAETYTNAGRYADAEAEALPWIEEPSIPAMLRIRATEYVARARFQLGRYEEARAGMTDALKRYRDALGPDHPTVARVTNTLGSIAVEMGDAQAALDAMHEVVRIAHVVVGPEHPMVANAEGNLGIAYLLQGDIDRAVAAQRRALEIFDRSLPEGHRLQIQARVNLSELVDEDEAEALLARALTLAEASSGADGVEATSARSALGELYLRTGRAALARRELRRALEAHESFGRSRRALVDRANLARALVALDKVDDARPLAEDALEEAEGLEGGSESQLTTPLLAMALVEQAEGHPERARALLERAAGLRDAKWQSRRSYAAVTKMLAQGS